MTYNATSAAIIGASAEMQELRAQIARIAPTRLAVLIQGETGSGKELVAQALHAASGRRGPFVAFNVCAVAETMFEATLFGHVRGAFSGAVTDVPGYLAQAQGGTLFLDEISGFPLPLQSKLLRALETQEYRPVGAKADRRTDFRVVAASNEGILTLVRDGRIRRDLAHRLGAAVLDVPPLRRRLDDVPMLAEHFAQRATEDGGSRCTLSEAAVRRLAQHRWPGNVRELRNVIELAITLADSPVIGVELIGRTLAMSSMLLDPAANETALSWEDARRRELLAALEQHHGDTARVAAQFGVDRRTIYRWMEQLAIPTRKRPTGGRHPTPH